MVVINGETALCQTPTTDHYNGQYDTEPCPTVRIEVDSWHRKLQEETVGNYSLPQRCPEINDAPDGLHVHEHWHWDCPH